MLTDDQSISFGYLGCNNIKYKMPVECSCHLILLVFVLSKHHDQIISIHIASYKAIQGEQGYKVPEDS
jgi:hypothetical protein